MIVPYLRRGDRELVRLGVSGRCNAMHGGQAGQGRTWPDSEREGGLRCLDVRDPPYARRRAHLAEVVGGQVHVTQAFVHPEGLVRDLRARRVRCEGYGLQPAGLSRRIKGSPARGGQKALRRQNMRTEGG